MDSANKENQVPLLLPSPPQVDKEFMIPLIKYLKHNLSQNAKFGEYSSEMKRKFKGLNQ